MPAGRFAPSPTGPLHLGSLLTAVASYLAAKQAGLQWLLRIDDLDTARNIEGADRQIIGALEAHGLYPDAPVIYQSERSNRYAQALTLLQERGQCFYCTCSRKSLPKGKPYPGTCRNRTTPLSNAAVRMHLSGEPITFEDTVQGTQSFDLEAEGDQIILRRDGVYAYHLACAVDDGADEIVQVVRGVDLLQSTAPQLAIMRALGLCEPAYAHVPVVTNRAGQKLSKQTHADPVDTGTAEQNLQRVLSLLGLALPTSRTQTWRPSDWLQWGTSCFAVDRMPQRLPPGSAGDFELPSPP